VAIDSAGNVAVTGYSAESHSTDNPWQIGIFQISINLDFYTAKYAAADGNLMWERRGPLHGGLSDDPRNDAIKLAIDPPPET